MLSRIDVTLSNGRSLLLVMSDYEAYCLLLAHHERISKDSRGKQTVNRFMKDNLTDDLKVRFDNL